MLRRTLRRASFSGSNNFPPLPVLPARTMDKLPKPTWSRANHLPLFYISPRSEVQFVRFRLRKTEQQQQQQYVLDSFGPSHDSCIFYLGPSLLVRTHSYRIYGWDTSGRGHFLVSAALMAAAALQPPTIWGVSSNCSNFDTKLTRLEAGAEFGF